MNTKSYSAADCQQLGPISARVVSIHPGPCTVRVHETLTAEKKGEASRYFLSVDLKFRPQDALQDFGWYGMTKAEATRAANALTAKIASQVGAVEAAESSTRPGADLLVKRQRAALRAILDRYTAEFL